MNAVRADGQGGPGEIVASGVSLSWRRSSSLRAPSRSLACTLTAVRASFLPLGRALALTTARAFFPAASALLVGTILFAAVPFGGDGVHCADVVAAMDRWPFARVTLWALWLSLSTPVSTRLVSASWIRAQPVRTAHAVAWLVSIGLVAQIPWMLLFAVGEGPLRALANGFLALGFGFAAATGSLAPSHVVRAPRRARGPRARSAPRVDRPSGRRSPRRVRSSARMGRRAARGARTRSYSPPVEPRLRRSRCHASRPRP